MIKIIKKIIKKERIYISGPVTGLDPYYVKGLFTIAENKLKNEGLRPVSPIRYIAIDREWRQAMGIALSLLISCEGIYMLPGWEKSEGATCELFYALITGKDIYFENSDPQCISFNKLIEIANKYYNN